MPTAGPTEVIELLVLERLFHAPQQPAPSFDLAWVIQQAQNAGVPAAYLNSHVIVAIIIGMLRAGYFDVVDPALSAALSQGLQPRFNARRRNLDLFHQFFALNHAFNAQVTLTGLRRRDQLLP